jgi:hypothetical protein
MNSRTGANLLDSRGRWQRLEDHTEGFRNFAAYQEWKQLLHHFYDPFPVVEHFIRLT